MKDQYLQRGNKTWHRKQAKNYPENWATEDEVFDFLYGFVRAIKPEKVLEIGTFEGDTAIAIGKALRDNNFGHLITTDIKDFGQEQNIKEADLNSFVTCIKKNPVEFLNTLTQEYDMIFIDDGHSHAEVIRDLEVSHRLTKNNGYILGHDILMIPTVSSAYNNFLERNKNQYHHLIINSYCGVFILKKIYG